MEETNEKRQKEESFFFPNETENNKRAKSERRHQGD
jgi:hypothetical protein